MNIHELDEKLQVFNRDLLKNNWHFKRYFNKDMDLNYYENFDEMTDMLNIVNEFYLNEAIISLEKNNNNDNSLENLSERKRENIKQISELHYFFVVMEYIYFYKLKRILDFPDINYKITKWIDFSFDFFIISDLLLHHYSKFFSVTDTLVMHFNSWESDDFYKNIFESFTKFTEDILKSYNEYIDEIQKGILYQNEIFNYATLSDIKLIDKDLFTLVKRYIFSNSLESIEFYKLAFENKDISCYATIEYDNKKFITVNGLNNSKGREEVLNFFKESLQKIKGIDVKIVDISDDVRYYLNESSDYIEYKDFQNAKLCKCFNRMFTCCERKLFAEIRKVINKELNTIEGNQKIHLSTTKVPCEMCKREIKNITKYKLKVIIADKDNSQLDLKKFDYEAETILKVKNSNLNP